MSLCLRATPALCLLLAAAPQAVRAQQAGFATTYRAAADSLIRGAALRSRRNGIGSPFRAFS